MYKNIENKQKERHPATKPLTIMIYYLNKKPCKQKKV